MHLNSLITARVRNNNYPVTVTGSGLPIIAIGIGTLALHTLSARFKQSFTLYATDVYWDQKHSLVNPTTVTFATILDDIAELGTSLGLSRYFIFAHSAYGIVALEFAKKYPSLVAGIIMSGTPVNSNPDVAATNNAYFEQYADENRKAIDAQRRKIVAQEDLALLTTSERFLHEYVYRDAARYWHVPDFDCSALWKGIVLDRLVDHFFAQLLPSVDVSDGLEAITCPIFLAAGTSDYDCCPFFWASVPNLPKQMIISLFTQSGHWPHYEEQDLFDSRIEAWLRNIA